MPVIKKTVALHPIADRYIRLTWASLIKEGYDATYSTALNWMLIAIIWELSKSKGKLKKSTLDTLADFMNDPEAAGELNAQDYIETLDQLGKSSGKMKEG